MTIKQLHKVPDGIVPERFVDYAMDVFKVIPSRNGIKKAIKRGDFLIDGANAETGTWVKPGQIIELLEPVRALPPVYHAALEVMYEDEYLAVVIKPAGFVVNGNRFKTIENALPYNLAKSAAEGALSRPRPVHRLDSPTSGLLLIAKTIKAQINLGNQFEANDIKKRYRAVLRGRIENYGRIVSDIDGRYSETEFSPVKSVRSIKNGWVTLADLFPKTGRTHQLRRHMSEAGYPIIGDKVYDAEDQLFKGKGLFLASVELLFTHPDTGLPVNISIDEPVKFRTFMDREERRWKQLYK